MEIKETFIKDLLIIQPSIFPDERGYFFESYNSKKFNADGLTMNFVQDNISKSQKGVLRGLHFQNPPYSQGKLVYVLRGEVLDVAVDLRKDSPTYGKHFTLRLSEKNKIQLYIPEGFAHGFATLEDNTIFAYKCTDYYNKTAEASIAWDDPMLGIDWLVEKPIISEKDQIASAFNDLDSPF